MDLIDLFTLIAVDGSVARSGCLSIQDRVQFAGEIIVEITVNG